MKPELLLWAAETHQTALVDWLQQQRGLLARFRLVAAGSLGAHLERAGLRGQWLASAAELGQQMGKADSQLVILLPGSEMEPQQLREWVARCETAQVPLALNLATAQMVLRAWAGQRLGYLIFNPISGQGDETQQLALIRQRLGVGMHLHVLITQPDRGAKSLAEEALAAQPDLVIASGGDGTVSAVAGVLLGSGIPLGVIPRGTANAFAAALGIPDDLERACDLILAGSTRVVDAARCDGEPMILLAGIGFEAETIERASRELKTRFGPLAYLVAGLQQLGEQQPFQVTMQVDGAESEPLQATALTIANAAPATSVLAQGRGQVNPRDGKLDVTLVRSQSDPSPKKLSQGLAQRVQAAGDLVHLLGASLARQVPQLEGILTLKASRIRVEATPPQKVVIDGEVVGTTPVQIEVIPAGLTVIAPPVQRPNSAEKIAIFWVKRISPSLTLLTATVGLGGILGSAFALWGLSWALEGLQSPGQNLDEWVLQGLHQASPWLDPLARLGWGLGHPLTLVALLLLGTGWLWRQQHRRQAGGLVLAGLGAGILAGILKPTFSRERPDLWDPILSETGYSFPSGQVIGATVIYGLLGYFSAKYWPEHRLSIRWGVLGILLFIGLSRAYLGLNWPSDLLAGYSLGSLWLITCITMWRIQDLRQSAKAGED
ncbi:YegS/Rv2252/BmrU family lipid kinase [Thermostichus vulcanus]|uniref:YegS/Rv2252/BmrU family lipid kinase n=1 Tax=Thermostichus vulcanus str. 'Rupite' TaxID=2813851 RepID=A0ABT0CE41_THEVL|nr:YegS/Rv2252/BmrU family lipid kinase [Thermostichus vulcanus]MCJ2544033.1 YegS/Rv2252/BmrU family lipid kinase [Thermostichus vulcanus str. 'Rupite']